MTHYNVKFDSKVPLFPVQSGALVVSAFGIQDAIKTVEENLQFDVNITSVSEVIG
jgi:hypothetical protein